MRENGHKNIPLDSEERSEFDDLPTACQKSNRVVVLKMNLTVERCEQALIDEIRYFFCITNDYQMSAEKVVYEVNARCEHQNLTE